MPNCVNCGRPVAYSGSGEVPKYCWQCERQVPVQNVPAATQRASASRFPVTLALLGINVLVYVAMVLSGVSATDPTPEQLIRWGADYAPLTLTAESWRLLTSAFVHIGFFHLLVNMWSLWNLGQISENIFRRLSFLLIYLYTAVSASLLYLDTSSRGERRRIGSNLRAGRCSHRCTLSRQAPDPCKEPQCGIAESGHC